MQQNTSNDMGPLRHGSRGQFLRWWQTMIEPVSRLSPISHTARICWRPIALALTCVLTSSPFALANAKDFVPISTSGYTADTIANGIGIVASSTTHDVDGVGFAFVSRDWKLTSASTELTWGLPTNGTIQATGRTYQLQSYSEPNDLRLTSTLNSGTLTFETASAHAQLSLLTTSGSGTSTLNITVEFTDGTLAAFDNRAVSDWYGGSEPVIQGFGRVNRSNNVLESNLTNPRLYPIDLMLTCADQQKSISKITIDRTGGTGITNVLALSGTAPDPLSSGAISGAANIQEGSAAQLTVGTSGGTWTSDDPSIASVDDSGNVSALSAGSTTIRYRAAPCSNAATHALTIQPAAVSTTTTLITTPKTPALDQTLTLTAELMPATATGLVAFYSDADAATAVPGCSAQTVTQGQASCTVTPTAVGSYTYLAQYTPADSTTLSSTSPSVTVAVVAPVPALAMTSTSLGDLQVGQAVNHVQLSASGGSGAYTWSATDSAQPLPAGLSLSPAGVLSGTPSSTGSYTAAITVTDGSGASQQLHMSTKAAASLTQVFTGTVAAAAALPAATPVPSLGTWAIALVNLVVAVMCVLAWRWRRKPFQA